MRAVFIGGGSFRTLPIVRAAMRDPRVFEGGEIRLVDFNLARAETVASLIWQMPEARRCRFKVSCTDDLDRALRGADVVSVSFPVGSPMVLPLSDWASTRQGFMSSDQISVSGAFRSLTGGSVILNFARKMERYCPKAWLVIFANPVAVYSGMVNNHTRIRALGVCDVAVAGVNHVSFILRGTCKGRDLYRVVPKYLTKNWKPPRIPTFPMAEKSIQQGLRRMIDTYRRFGYFIFSTEGDGMAHLYPEEMWPQPNPKLPKPSLASLRAGLKAGQKARAEADRTFAEMARTGVTPTQWKTKPCEQSWLAPAFGDVLVLVLQALSGTKKVKFVANRPASGAVAGFKSRTVMEYSMTMDRSGVYPDRDLEVPDCFHGLMTALATHQTLLGDAVATGDPRLFAQALQAYPIHQGTRRSFALFRELLKIHAPEIPAVFQKAADYLGQP
jgi:alpha-galactosidase/6-phospho-beta-glucosidase family protein